MVDRVQLGLTETGPNAPPPQPAPDPNRPAWLPENFKTPEDLAKSYKEAQAEITRMKQGKPAEGTPSAEGTPPPANADGATPPAAGSETPPVETPPAPDDAAKKVVDAAGLDVAPYSTEFATTGDVTPENRKKIADGLKGILGDQAESIVNNYIEGQKAVVQNDNTMYQQAAGGKDALDAMLKWAPQNLSQEDITHLNKQFDSGDRTAILFAVETLKTRYEAKEGRVPNLIGGNLGAGRTSQGFQSSAQMVTAMNDPRYKTDEAYRKEIKARIAVSNF